MKLKSITSEQYRTLVALGMPAYSSSYSSSVCIRFYFWTLVEEESTDERSERSELDATKASDDAPSTECV